MKFALAWGLLLAIGCGRHDTPVASYYLQTTAGSGGTGGGAGTSAGGSAGAPFELMCPADYMAVAGLTSRYKQFTTGKPWVEAARDCEADGTHLIVIDSDAENTWMAGFALESETDSKSTNHLSWLGLGDSGSEGQFRWVTGATLGIAYWSDNEEPNSLYHDEDCVEMHSSATWNDDRCDANLTYVCECDGAPSAFEWCDTSQEATCGQCDLSCDAGQTCVKQECQ